MAEEFLDGADVVAIFEQVGGEGVAEGVATDGLIDACQFGRFSDGSLRAAFAEVMAAYHAGAGVFGDAPGREDVLPTPLAVGVGVLSFEGGGEVDSAVAVGQVLLVEHVGALQLFLEGLDGAIGEHRDPVFHPFGTFFHFLLPIGCCILGFIGVYWRKS